MENALCHMKIGKTPDPNGITANTQGVSKNFTFFSNLITLPVPVSMTLNLHSMHRNRPNCWICLYTNSNANLDLEKNPKIKAVCIGKKNLDDLKQHQKL